MHVLITGLIEEHLGNRKTSLRLFTLLLHTKVTEIKYTSLSYAHKSFWLLFELMNRVQIPLSGQIILPK